MQSEKASPLPSGMPCLVWSGRPNLLKSYGGVAGERLEGNTSECMLDLVSRWVNCHKGTGDLPRKWQTVVEAVRDTGFEPLAKELAQKHGVTLTQQ